MFNMYEINVKLNVHSYQSKKKEKSLGSIAYMDFIIEAVKQMRIL